MKLLSIIKVISDIINIKISKLVIVDEVHDRTDIFTFPVKNIKSNHNKKKAYFQALFVFLATACIFHKLYSQFMNVLTYKP